MKRKHNLILTLKDDKVEVINNQVQKAAVYQQKLDS